MVVDGSEWWWMVAGGCVLQYNPFVNVIVTFLVRFLSFFSGVLMVLTVNL